MCIMNIHTYYFPDETALNVLPIYITTEITSSTHDGEVRLVANVFRR